MTDQALSGYSPQILSLMQELSAVAVAVVDLDGRLMACNKGFCLLIGSEGPPEAIGNIRPLFVQPNFADLLALSEDSEDVVYQGVMNLGRADTQVNSITGSVYSNGNNLLLVGEHDVLDLQRLSATVIELNEELAETQRGLVRTNRELERNEARIHQLMLTDPLTCIPNRRHFNEHAIVELDRAQRYGMPLSLCITDIDHFKHINDEHGHNRGDKVLREFAGLLQHNLRSSDFLARFGGEEFVLILPSTGLEGGAQVAEKIRNILSHYTFAGLERPVTASFGIATLQPPDDVDSLLQRADQALYRSKANGRNQVTTWAKMEG